MNEKQISAILKEHGHEVYMVGGCVRDRIMQKPAHDIDLATSAMPEEVMSIFPDAVPTGIKHGTVMVSGFEITTYRIDGDYGDGRHPDKVTFTRSLEEDTKRRDFTMNALAMDLDCNVVDYHKGLDDIRDGIIRCVGDPMQRFTEDGLRILRGVRFSSQFGFTIEPATRDAMTACKSNLGRISAERIFSEIMKTLQGDYVEQALLENYDILTEVIPEIRGLRGFNQNNPHHIYDVWEHTVKAVAFAPKDLRVSMLLHDIGKPACYSETDGVGHFHGHPVVGRKLAENFFARMKADTATSSRALVLIEHHDINLSSNAKSIRRNLNRFGEDIFRDILAVRRADILAQNPDYRSELNEINAVEEELDHIIAEGDCFTIKDLNVDGYDVMNAGVTEGTEVGRVLNALLEMVMDDTVKNERKALLEKITELR